MGLERLDILSEFLGTLILILLGNGVVYSVSGKRMFGNQPGKWVVIILGWGLAVLLVLLFRNH
ncbi:aquaporin [Mycoplasmopsis felis]|uniref:aquaporin n=1 Tax=Mycoplasmopsis felis TaxID=33923 RepID=UPI0021AFCDFE|nr:aquaporin [Mycoplasmopsis felis]UWV79766.1 aquaporin [Mycoplasmopsis felis]WAM01016.1 aquaporin [Mycoplasmopsis felis]